ncbi:hypothetical protein NP233_g6821 [Leucocoprinus birnbaumii]|uniref:Protein kinase domain-containing protein n=1 Tax=Leucocoprinus birnbaumii TaxID=56174 RepID=A0AAD5YPN7_9AGAR|nr:hypothetical protein NP233_g6821 [Leucocoprinus birnbaumii]
MSSENSNQDPTNIVQEGLITVARQLALELKSRSGPEAEFAGEGRLMDLLHLLLAQHIKSTVGELSSLGKDEIRPLINYLDDVLRTQLKDHKDRARALALLSKVIASTRISPERLIIDRVGYRPHPQAIGGSGAVYQGLDPDICVKVMLQVDSRAFAICLVSPFMKRGNLHDYAPKIPQRARLSLLLDVINGLLYLHDLDIVHSDLKGQNVLITGEGRAVITDFGSSRVSTITNTTTTATSWTLCFAAPELVVGGEKATKMSDVWSFGCLTYETLSRRPPYYQYGPNQIFAVFLRKEPPQRPGTVKSSRRNSFDEDHSSDEDDELYFDLIEDDAWDLISRCCMPNPTDRLEALAVQKLMRFMTEDSDPYEDISDLIPSTKTAWEKMCRLQADRAQALVNHIHSHLFNPVLPTTRYCIQPLSVLSRLCQASSLLPHQEILTQPFTVDYAWKRLASSGVLGRGRLGSKLVCMKIVQLNNEPDMLRWRKNCIKEAILLRQLRHSNIMAFYGVHYFEEKGRQLCGFVFPWLRNGNIAEYIHHNKLVPREPLVYDIAAALNFLHNLGIIHGDLRGKNVFVTEYERACLTGFELSSITLDESLVYVESASIQSTIAYRWASPELVRDGIITAFSDVWAFGCVCYEIIVGKVPFDTLQSDTQVLKALTAGKLPMEYNVMDTSSSSTLRRAVWQQVHTCWNLQAEERPTIREVLSELESAGLRRVDLNESQQIAERKEQLFWDRLRRSQEPIDNDVAEQVIKELRDPVVLDGAVP